MRIFRLAALILAISPEFVFSQVTAEKKLVGLERSASDTSDFTGGDLYLADTLPIAEYDTTYFIAGDPEYNLIRAAEFGQIEVVKLLVGRGIHVDASTYEGVTPLMYAAQNGDIEIMEFLLGNKADMNRSPGNGVTALIGAVRTEQYTAAELLLDSGARVDARDEFDLTSLMHASAYNYPYIVELLLENGADPEKKDMYGSGPLMMAAYYNCLEAAEILLDYGADQDGKDNHGFTPLMVAAQHGDYDMAWMLLDRGADPSIRNEGGLHALAFAVMRSDEDIIELLLENGANINQDINGSTNALNIAVETGDEALVDYLTNNRARLNRKPEFSEIRGGITLNFNADDFMMGFEAGLSESKYNLYLTTGFIFRPAYIRVLRQESDTLSFQFWEKRFFWPFTLGRDFTFYEKGTKSYTFRVHLTGALTYGNYRGSARNPETRYLLFPGAGIAWKDRFAGISFDYQYVPVKVHDISSHRFTLSINGFYDFRSRTRYTRKDISWF